MKCYIIMYDLRKFFRNYDELYSAIKSFDNWGKLTDHSWAVVSRASATAIRDYLLQFVDENDRIIVLKSSGEAAWQNMIADNAWAKNNLQLT